jgi:hypothetical protein
MRAFFFEINFCAPKTNTFYDFIARNILVNAFLSCEYHRSERCALLLILPSITWYNSEEITSFIDLLTELPSRTIHIIFDPFANIKSLSRNSGLGYHVAVGIGK